VILSILKASRPVSWINTAFPFAAGYLMTTRTVDAVFIVGTLFFLIPYNLLMYGVNDVFDYESDLANPRKGGIEGAVVRDRSAARRVHRGILRASALTMIPPFVWLLAQGGVAAGVTLTLVVGGVLAYSVPALRFKERAVLDSFTSAMHFCGPLVYALVLTGVSLGALHVWPVIGSFIAWGIASHAFGAVQDVKADRAADIGSIATALGARSTVWVALEVYFTSAALLLFLPGWFKVAALLPLPYAFSVARFVAITDQRCEEANRGWRTFLWLNQVVGFLVTMLLIAVWKDWI